MNQSDLHSSATFRCAEVGQQLTQLKIAARQQLLALSPEVAQQRVNGVLFPQYWELQVQDCFWEESIPTAYGEIDA